MEWWDRPAGGNGGTVKGDEAVMAGSPVVDIAAANPCAEPTLALQPTEAASAPVLRRYDVAFHSSVAFGDVLTARV